MLHVGVLCLIALITIFITRWVYKWRNPKCDNRILPPGSMGLPFIGETLELLIPGRSLDVHPFIKKRVKRYGPIFRTNILGKPVVVSTDPAVNDYLFLQEGKTVEFWYMDNLTKLLDKDGDSKTDAFSDVHRYVRSITMKYFGVNSLKEDLLPQIEEHVSRTLSSWSTEESINIKAFAAKMAFYISAKRMFSYDTDEHGEDLSEIVTNMLQTVMSVPLNVPGTFFHDCLKKKELVAKVIRKKLYEKLNSPDANQGDMLDQLVQDMNTETFITESFAIHVVFGLLLAGTESISTTLTLAFKFLSEHPSIVEELRVEHEEILGKRKLEVPLTWEECKSMTFTLQVINEVLRLSNTIPGLLRKATKDVQVNGYTIPQGWTIMLACSAQQLNPSTYKDPLTFNPHRWEELDPSMVSKTFMPFGVGIRQCAGADYSRMFLLTFFHVLCTKYRWTKLKGGDNISRRPLLDFGDGIFINIAEKT